MGHGRPAPAGGHQGGGGPAGAVPVPEMRGVQGSVRRSDPELIPPTTDGRQPLAGDHETAKPIVSIKFQQNPQVARPFSLSAPDRRALPPRKVHVSDESQNASFTGTPRSPRGGGEPRHCTISV